MCFWEQKHGAGDCHTVYRIPKLITVNPQTLTQTGRERHLEAHYESPMPRSGDKLPQQPASKCLVESSQGLETV
jgi:hypothetical protein